MKMIIKVKQVVFFFISALILVFAPKVCYAEKVTVDLVWKFPQPGWLEMEVRQGVYQLSYDNVKTNLQAGENLKIGQSGLAVFVYQNQNLSVLDKPLIRFTTQNNGIFRVREPGKDWISYRGNLVVTKEGLNWKLANTLDSEDYLKGVVPVEMSNAWAAKGFEALKAQAVAARTYLLKNMDANGRITDSPDIHQAYWGKTVEGEASRAVDATQGEILVDSESGQAISIYYSSHNGGFSEEAQHVWQNSDPHYVSQPDPFSDGVGGYVNHWRFWVAADVLGNSFGLSTVKDVNLKRYLSGRVYEVELIDWLGQKKTVTGGEFVRKFYPYGRELSQDSFLGRLFQVDYFLPKPLRDTLHDSPIFPIRNGYAVTGPDVSLFNSSNGGLTEQPREVGLFVFDGRGWGHGVGMSQWGAYNMAMKGYTYTSILSFYYKNSDLARI
ncbi:MAG: Amidase enhancer [Candidatus Dichloromethanomonas elyunquensis]|nr:MAG: Amidase enhancer [Candidatus Dichloromethanomonas elyunquensis]